MEANSLRPFQEAEYNFLKWLRYTFFREMKRTLILLLLFFPPLIYIGARWHGPVLSIFDGVAPLTKNTQTSAFEITPDQASFIYSDLMNYGRGHWGMVLVNSCTYVDDTSYYFLEYDHAIFGHNEVAPSYYAKRFGMRMNGNDGTIYCPVSGEWIPRGYVHITRGEFASQVTAGMTTYLVKRIVGTPFGKESIDGYTIWLYWCKDGEIWVRVYEGEVESVHNIDLNRV